MISTSELRLMPSSLNDACRKMELAADCIDILRLRLCSAEGEVIHLKGFIEQFGRPLADPPEGTALALSSHERQTP